MKLKKIYLATLVATGTILSATSQTAFAYDVNSELIKAYSTLDDIKTEKQQHLDAFNNNQLAFKEFQSFALLFGQNVNFTEEPLKSLTLMKNMLSNQTFRNLITGLNDGSQAGGQLRGKLENLSTISIEEIDKSIAAVVYLDNKVDEQKTDLLIKKIIQPLLDYQNENLVKDSHLYQYSSLQHKQDFLKDVKELEEDGVFVKNYNQHLKGSKGSEIKINNHNLVIGANKKLDLDKEKSLSFGAFADLGFSGDYKDINYSSKNKSVGMGIYANFEKDDLFLTALAGVEKVKFKDKIIKQRIDENHDLLDMVDENDYSRYSRDFAIELGYKYKLADYPNLTFKPSVHYQYNVLLGEKAKTSTGSDVEFKNDEIHNVGLNLRTVYDDKDLKFTFDVGVDRIIADTKAQSKDGTTGAALITTSGINVLNSTTTFNIPTVAPTTEKLKEYKLSTKINLEKYLTPNSKIGGNVGYAYYTKTKLKGFNYGVSYTYEF